MAKGIKIALPGYDAQTDTDPNHFALFVDGAVDYVLIKEKLKATVSVTGNVNIAHGLGYVPLVMVFAEFSSGVWRRLYSQDIGGWGPHYTIDATNLSLYNYGTAIQFSYHIFFDKIS